MLKDTFGRSFPYIRLSITDVCNFKCGYCLPNGYQVDKSDNRTFLKKEEIGRLAKALSELGVCKIRLTGGEPTVRKDFIDIVKNLKSLPGIKKVVMTTNGYNLKQIAKPLMEQKIDGINISIDSLDREKFKFITGMDKLEDILAGLKLLQENNFKKINKPLLDSLGKKIVIMHPGPINREVEISSQIADDKKYSVILEQVESGIAVRKALLEFLMNSGNK